LEGKPNKPVWWNVKPPYIKLDEMRGEKPP